MKIPDRFHAFPTYSSIEPFEVLSARLGRDPGEIIKLDANENPYGPSPLALQALAELRYPHIYPDPESRALRAALAAFSKVPVENLLAGSGADELIDLILRALLEPGDKVVICPPTFGMYAFDTRLNAGQVIEINRRVDFSLDVDAVCAAARRERPRALFLAVPNNPDGSLPSEEEIEALLDLPDVLVVIDEAYIEFAAGGGRLGERLSHIGQVSGRENLVVLRTFSKWAGLAGLRVGYGAFPAWLTPVLWKIKQPYNVSVAASAAAIASLNDLDVLAGRVELLKQERARLFQKLSAISYLHPFPSEANFILNRVTGLPALDLQNELAGEGILVRYYNTPLLSDAVRIGVGRPLDTDALIAALAALEVKP